MSIYPSDEQDEDTGPDWAGGSMTYTQEQINAAARLVPEHTKAHKECVMSCGRLWQPDAPTEAGRSDALVLLAAVQCWIEYNAFDDPLLDCHMSVVNALGSGNVEAIQAAVMAAAVAIGETLNG